jgi:hypothetical protein
MGQYYNVEQRYKYINIDKRIIVCANYGLELCKHSWLGNNSVVIPIKQLVKTEWQGDRVIQLGDCVDGMAASTELREEHLKFIKKIKKEVGMTNNQSLYWDNVADEGETFKKYTLKELFDSYDLKLEYDAEYMPVTFNEKGQKCSCDQFRYLYNTKRKEYVDSFKILPSYVEEYKSEINFVKLDAYSLLIAIGNGLGGGDYFGPDENLVGLWATTSDSIIISEKSPKEYAEENSEVENYTELVPLFCEHKPIENEALFMQRFLSDEEEKQGITLSYKLNAEGVLEPKKLEMLLEQHKRKVCSK